MGNAIARLAVKDGLHPIIAGRDAYKVTAQAAEIGMECRVFDLDDPRAIDQALKEVDVVLHCAGPFIHTPEPIAAQAFGSELVMENNGVTREDLG